MSFMMNLAQDALNMFERRRSSFSIQRPAEPAELHFSSLLLDAQTNRRIPYSEQVRRNSFLAPVPADAQIPAQALPPSNYHHQQSHLYGPLMQLAPQHQVRFSTPQLPMSATPTRVIIRQNLAIQQPPMVVTMLPYPTQDLLPSHVSYPATYTVTNTAAPLVQHQASSSPLPAPKSIKKSKKTNLSSGAVKTYEFIAETGVEYPYNKNRTEQIQIRPQSKVVDRPPSTPYMMVRGARKSNYDDLEVLEALNSNPYKYCFRLMYPLHNDDGTERAPLTPEKLQLFLICLEPAKEYSVDNGLVMEKIHKQFNEDGKQQIEFKVTFNVFSQKFSGNGFALRITDGSQQDRIIYASHKFMIFARRKRRGKARKADEQDMFASNESPKKRSKHSTQVISDD